MKKEWMILGFVLIIVIFAGFYFFKNPNVVKEIPSGDYNIEINNFAFAPQELIVKVGSTVVWNNKDSVKHTVTSDSGTELGSELSSINVGKKQTNGRYLGLLKQRLIDLLQVHNATESEIDSVYQHIIMEVLPKTNK